MNERELEGVSRRLLETVWNEMPPIANQVRREFKCSSSADLSEEDINRAMKRTRELMNADRMAGYPRMRIHDLEEALKPFVIEAADAEKYEGIPDDAFAYLTKIKMGDLRRVLKVMPPK